MKNTLLNLYEKDGTKKVLASLISIFAGLFVGAIVVVIVGLVKSNISFKDFDRSLLHRSLCRIT